MRTPVGAEHSSVMPRKLREPQLPPGLAEGKACQPEGSGISSAGAARASSLFPGRTLYLYYGDEQDLFTQLFWQPVFESLL